MLDDMMAPILEYFYQEYNYAELKFKLIVTPDINSKYLELTKTRDKISTKENKNFLDSLNGTAILPDNFSDEPTILLNESAITEDLVFVGTIVHEMTHLFDYRDLASFLGINTYNNLRDYEFFPEFYFWTEFHARRCGHKFYKKLMWREQFNSEEHLAHLIDVEAPFQLKELCERLNEYRNDYEHYMYALMQYMGRYSVWQDLFPSVFYDFPACFNGIFNGMLFQIYDCLHEHNEFALMQDCFSNLHDLFSLMQ